MVCTGGFKLMFNTDIFFQTFARIRPAGPGL